MLLNNKPSPPGLFFNDFQGDEKMKRELTGKANHVFSKDEIASLDVNEFISDDPRQKSFVTVANESESVIIHSIEQWEQLDALARKAFNNLSD